MSRNFRVMVEGAQPARSGHHRPIRRDQLRAPAYQIKNNGRTV
ncbi:hypothetical protein ACRAWD_16685 [Caulobacter segnis]